MDIIRTTSSDLQFVELVRLLDAELAERDGEAHSFYHQFNKIDMLKHVIILREEGIAMACGAIKEFEKDKVEVKRMYTRDLARGRGFAMKVLNALEEWSKELNYRYTVLETGLKQPEAIALYKRSGYKRIPNYGQYQGIENSVCFSKDLFETD